MVFVASLAFFLGAKVAQIGARGALRAKVELALEGRFPGAWGVQVGGKLLGLAPDGVGAAAALLDQASGSAPDLASLPPELPEGIVLAYLKRVGRLVSG